MKKNIIQWKLTGGPFRDCTSNYEGILIEKITVKDFLLYLKDKNEWGSIEVNGVKICDYNRGSFRSANPENYERFKDYPLEQVSANGGWSLMDYDITVRDLEYEKKYVI